MSSLAPSGAGSAACLSSRTPARPAAATDTTRWEGLDLLRLLAMLLMVQGHAFRVVLAPAVREAPWFTWHDFVHGFTAPAFLLGAGLAWGVATFPRFDAHARPGPATHRRFMRYALLFAIGCALNLPDMSFGRALASPARFLAALQIGPLHLLGLVLAVMEGAALATRSRRKVACVAAIGAAGVLLGAPIVGRFDAQSGVPEALRALLNGTTGSSFPLFPWGGLALLGIVAAHLALDARGRLRRAAVHAFALVGAALFFGCYALYRAGFAPYGPHDFWRTSPIYTGFLAGGVAMLLALASLAAPRLPNAVRRWVGGVARESLVVYVAHLVVLYGSPLSRGLRHAPGATLALPAACAVTGVLLAAMLLLATLWPGLLRRGLWSRSLVRLPITGLLVYVLLLR
jgi:uncharacterized membrane protein